MEGDGSRPWDQRSARLWNFFNTGEDFYKIQTWPNYVAAMALKAHKNYRERYRLFLFFVANGIAPEVAYYWVCMRDYENGEPVYEAYDASANAQMNAQIQAARNGSIFNGKSWFDMHLGRVVHVPP